MKRIIYFVIFVILLIPMVGCSEDAMREAKFPVSEIEQKMGANYTEFKDQKDIQGERHNFDGRWVLHTAPQNIFGHEFEMTYTFSTSEKLSKIEYNVKLDNNEQKTQLVQQLIRYFGNSFSLLTDEKAAGVYYINDDSRITKNLSSLEKNAQEVLKERYLIAEQLPNYKDQSLACEVSCKKDMVSVVFFCYSSAERSNTGKETQVNKYMNDFGMPYEKFLEKYKLNEKEDFDMFNQSEIWTDFYLKEPVDIFGCKFIVQLGFSSEYGLGQIKYVPSMQSTNDELLLSIKEIGNVLDELYYEITPETRGGKQQISNFFAQNTDKREKMIREGEVGLDGVWEIFEYSPLSLDFKQSAVISYYCVKGSLKDSSVNIRYTYTPIVKSFSISGKGE